MGHTRLEIQSSKKVKLEGIIGLPDGTLTSPPVSVLCHSHPMLGGDMENDLISAIDSSCIKKDIACLRFNFRGVGESTGAFSSGKREQDDLLAALKILNYLKWTDSNLQSAIGHSFGASVLLKSLRRLKSIKAMVLISPPLSSLNISMLSKSNIPKFFLIGENDKVTTPSALKKKLDEIHQPFEFYEVPNADHSLLNHENIIAERISEFIDSKLNCLKNNDHKTNMKKPWTKLLPWQK